MLIVELIKGVATVILSALSLLIVIRVLYPIFADPEQSLLYSFAYATTQPFAQPVSDFLESKLDLPIATDDLGALVALLVISVVSMILAFFG
ncbi:MAG: YggT family protein [Clostridia bacterium]|nr:YggT family protein [Clostridia bacterium]MBO4860408.1 YggT family protein [Clostridia bacterium]MBO7399758.1 YggT family protein [Clostridia bacterium]MBO7666267.1 YggT family protein [Clostridia bacterium]MBP5238089.1 YggT family protein [Clostridia bacterium]